MSVPHQPAGPNASPDLHAAAPTPSVPGPAHPGLGAHGPAPRPGAPAPVDVGRSLALAALVVAASLTVLRVIGALLAFSAVGQYESARSIDVLTGMDVVLALTFPVMIAAYVLTSLWLWRARAAAEAVSARPHSRSRVWVWLGWVVPIVSLIFPMMVVRDVYAAHVDAAGGDVDGAVKFAQRWWGGMLASIMLGALAQQELLASDRGQDLQMFLVLNTVSAVALVVALVLWVRLVREVLDIQKSLAARQQQPVAAV